jgi:hypothetical protein
LYDQKYPKQHPQSFRTPYYQRALSGIRDYYRKDLRVAEKKSGEAIKSLPTYRGRGGRRVQAIKPSLPEDFGGRRQSGYGMPSKWD